ncbi:MAG: TraM recognition domain-containing protein [Clostridia bacterium]|nr:TraM recognition domain-containing protein [Clostridia bacterium]
MIGKILSFFKKIIYKIMDPIDALLKPFNIDLNSFFAYLFAIITILFSADRLLELVSVLFTGQFVNYWSPVMYTFALFILVSGYSILCASPFCKTITQPVTFYVYYLSAFRIIATVMVAQWVNEISWMVLMNFSNFKYIAINLPEIITPAITSLTLLYPLLSLKQGIYYYIEDVMDCDQDWIDSFEDFKGFKLVPAKSTIKTPDVFLCNAQICIDDQTGKPAVIPEKKRFEAVLVEGATGTGKTATIVEPMCAMDLERKYFFREVSKKLGYNALHAGLATLRVPYSNEYLNRTFTLSYLKPNESRLSEYKNYVKDMFKYEDKETKELYYRGLGFTLVAPDNACIERVRKVAAAYDIPVNIIDPSDPNSKGINPFIGTDPAKVASIISTVLKGMYESENSSGDNVFFANVSQQAFENLAILLKLIYPRMHNGDLPTLEDMLAILNNFDIAEEMTEVLKKDPVLSEDYKSLVGYFEKNFYKPPVNIHGYEIASTYGSGRKETEKHVYGAITQLDNFLRNPGVKHVLCSRDNNVDLDKALADGEIITACTRQGDLGELHQRAFGMFVILSMKDAVLRRPGIEDTRTPHFIYIDEFPLYVNKDTEAFFTLFRKYRVGTLITIQNLSQLTKNRSLAYFKDVIITNTKTQIVFGDMTAEESDFWSKELGNKKKWKYKRVLADPTTQEGADKLKANFMTAETDYKPYYKPAKIVNLAFKTCVYRTKNDSGKSIVGRGKTDFINKKYYEPHKSANYNFEIFKPDDSEYEETSKIPFTNSDENISYSTAINNNDDVLVQNQNYYTPSFSDDLIDININSTAKNNTTPIPSNELYIDVNHDGINDFVIENYITSINAEKPNEFNMSDLSGTSSEPITLDLKKKND